MWIGLNFGAEQEGEMHAGGRAVVSRKNRPSGG